MNLSFRHYYLRWGKNLFFLFCLFLFVMTAARAAFVFFFGDLTELFAHKEDLLSAMFLGVRYDLMPLAYINALPFIILNLAYLLPGKSTIRLTRFSVVSTLCLGYLSLIWLYVADYGFYSYYQDHINILFFGLFEDDTQAILLTIWKNYNLPFWLSLLLILHYAFYRFVRFLFSPYDFDLKVRRFDWKMPIFFLTGLVVLAFFARGNFTRLPLSIEDAHISKDQFINKLSLNGPISLNRAIKIRRTFGQGSFDYMKKYGFSDWRLAYKAAFGHMPQSKNFISSLKARTPHNPILEERPPHVVLVVMESFGTYWNEHDSKTFNLLGDLGPHLKRGIYFKNFLSAENGTIGSIVSVATSQVIRPGARFLSESEYMRTPLNSSGHLPFKEKGYETNFLYGGKLGWRDLGKFLGVQGYDQLWGAEEVKEAMPELANINGSELGNEWGIYDEYLYAFLEEQLRTATRPQFFLVLTTSNHPPFEYPASYKPLPLTMTPEIQERVTVSSELSIKRFLGLQYANHKMGQFLDRIGTSNLKERVLVAITGDHSYWIAKGVGGDEEFKRYAVPFLISAPDYLKRDYDPMRFGSHEDIFPTLYHMTLSDQEYLKLGENLFEEESHAVNSSGLVANKKGAYHNGRYWKWNDLKKQILVPAEKTQELESLRRHHEALISITDLYLKEEKADTPAGGDSDQQ